MSTTPTSTGIPSVDDAAGSDDPVQVIQGLYAAFARRDIDAVFARFHDEITVRQSDELPWGGTYKGKDEAMRFFGTLTSHIDTQVDIDRLIKAGDAVVEVGRTRGRSIATGRDFTIDEVHVWRIRDGKVLSMDAFVDNAEMLAALSDSAVACG